MHLNYSRFSKKSQAKMRLSQKSMTFRVGPFHILKKSPTNRLISVTGNRLPRNVRQAQMYDKQQHYIILFPSTLHRIILYDTLLSKVLFIKQ